MANSACAVSEFSDVTTGYWKTIEMEGNINLKTEEES